LLEKFLKWKAQVFRYFTEFFFTAVNKPAGKGAAVAALVALKLQPLMPESLFGHGRLPFNRLG
jgi:hypothetical protein